MSTRDLHGYVSFGPGAPITDLLVNRGTELCVRLLGPQWEHSGTELCLRLLGPAHQHSSYLAFVAVPNLRQLPRTGHAAAVLRFPLGAVPPLPGPIPIWHRDRLLGQIWGLRLSTERTVTVPPPAVHSRPHTVTARPHPVTARIHRSRAPATTWTSHPPLEPTKLETP